MAVRSAIIALGANLGERAENMQRAIAMIADLIGPVEAESKFYQTAPLVLPGKDPENVPDYLNAVVCTKTNLEPEVILQRLLEIEQLLGRDRHAEPERWMSRLIDLDLIAIGEEVYSSQTLAVPHISMHERDFVLIPMLEVAPDWRHPILGKTVRELARELDILPSE